jgi:hypothetical protein
MRLELVSYMVIEMETPPTKRSPSSELESNSVKRPRVEDPIAEEKGIHQTESNTDREIVAPTKAASQQPPAPWTPPGSLRWGLRMPGGMEAVPQYQKRCDHCRKRHCACEGRDASHRCQQCIHDNCECVFGEAKRRGPKGPRKVFINDPQPRHEVLQVQLAEEKARRVEAEARLAEEKVARLEEKVRRLEVELRIAKLENTRPKSIKSASVGLSLDV